MNSDEPNSGDFRNLLEAWPGAVALFHSADGRLLEANDAFCRMVALPRSKIFGSRPRDGRQDDDRREDPRNVPRLAHMRASGANEVELAIRDVGRMRLPARLSAASYGGQACSAAFIVDPAECLREESLPVGDRSYRDLVENINDVLYATDENAVITYISPNIMNLSGYLPCELIGRNSVEFAHPDDQAERLVQFLKILAGEAVTSEYRFVTKAGEIRWARTSARSMTVRGQTVGTQGILVDISDRKRIEEALRQSEEKYRVLVQNAKDAVFVIQQECITFVNPSACALLGRAAEHLTGTVFSRFVHPDDQPAFDTYISACVNNHPCDPLAFQVVCADKQVKRVELVAARIVWEEKAAALFFLRDITLQTKMEMQLRQSQKLEALGTLSSGIAHNFNNLLMGINGNASLSLLHLGSRDPVRTYTEKILRLVESGSKLTAQLLDYARSSQSQVGPVDLNQLVNEACETLGATHKQFPVRLELARDLPSIKADKSQIEQVLLNLLLNAVDAMPDGGDIHVQTRLVTDAQKAFKPNLEVKRAVVQLSVTDSGIGMSPEVKARIFEPFFTTKELGRGTGLGLSTAHGIVQNHGGTIEVHSQPGSGSRFDIFLPAVDLPTTVPSALHANTLIQGRGTILVVDDEIDVLETSAELLEHSGFRVLTAMDGDTALEIYHRNSDGIDLIMIDIVMPGMNGKELYHRIRKVNAQAKILFFSGYSLDQQIEEMLRHGCTGFLQKPYDHQLLCYKIMDIIS